MPLASIDQYLAHYESCAHVPVPSDYLPFYLGDAHAGFVSPPVQSAILSADLLIQQQADAWVMHVDSSLNHRLASLANQLFKQGYIRHWRHELLDIWGDTASMGVVERATMRALGFKSLAVHLHAWTPEGRIWVAQRAASKSVDPNQWDTLVGGMVGAGEPVETALLRESFEEAGLSSAIIEQATLCTSYDIQRVVPEGLMREHTLVFDVTLPEGTVLSNQDGEVQAIKCIDFAELKAMLAHGCFTVDAALAMLKVSLHRGYH